MEKIEEVANIVNEVVSNEVTETVKVVETAIEKEVKEYVVNDLSDNSDVFITENDTFDIKISYYKVNNDFCIEGIDDEFDPLSPLVKHIDMTFKYPNQGDFESIMAQNEYKSPEKMTIIDVLQMELTRLVVLIRKWSLKAEFDKMVQIDPKIIKAMSNKVREKIGVRGIL